MSREKSKGSKQATAGEETFLLSGDLTLQTAGAVKELFTRAVAADGETTFRFDEIGAVDLSFIQILCAAQLAAHGQGKQIHFAGGWPEPLTRLLEESGLNAQIRCSPDGGIKCPWINNDTTDDQP